MSIVPTTLYQNSADALAGAGELESYTHPDYRYYKSDWTMIRDCIAGARRVKEKTTDYLPPLDDNAGTEYDAYMERAVFTNMTARTLGGWLGTVFRRPVKFDNVPENVLKYADRVSAAGHNANSYSKLLLQEILGIGRVGVLVDRDKDGKNKAYAAMYLAENILSWRTALIDGEEKTQYVLLREIVERKHYLDNPNDVKSASAQKLLSRAQGAERGVVLGARYRVLRFNEAGEYVQDVYEFRPNTVGDAREAFQAVQTDIKPTIGGAPLTEIPFYVAGPMGLGFHVQRAPLLDIADINIAHYRTSAQLEHGRFFTALPVYYVPDGGVGEGEYTVGPSVVWEVPMGSKPGILEYYGTGLGSLTASLQEKETHIAQLGGRVAGAGVRDQGSENSDVHASKQAHETSILLSATDAVSELMTKVMRLVLKWDRVDSADKATLKLNQDFKLQSVSARELRAVALLYQEGILPVDQLYRVLQESEYLSEDLTLAQFKKQLDDLNQFPNQPDVAAKHKGFPDAATMLQLKEGDKNRQHEADLQEQIDDAALDHIDAQGGLDMEATRQQQTFERQQAALDRKSEEKKAKDTAKVVAAKAKAGGEGGKKPAPGTKK